MIWLYDQMSAYNKTKFDDRIADVLEWQNDQDARAKQAVEYHLMTEEEQAIYDTLYLKFREIRKEFDLKFYMAEFDYMSKAEWSEMTSQE